MSWRKPSPASVPGLLAETVRRLVANHVVQMSAALAYYSALSLAPLVVISLGITGLLVDQATVRDRVAGSIGGLLGTEAANLIRTLGSEEKRTGAGAWATAAGVLMLAFGASAVFVQLQEGLNAIWRVPSPRGGLWKFLRTRLISMAMVFCLGFLLLVSMLANAMLTAVGERLGSLFGSHAGVALAVHLAASFAITASIFAVLFKLLPEAVVEWREAWLGGVLTAVLFQLGAWGIGEYVGRAGVGTAYGAAGSIVVLLVWVFYASLIVFTGAQLARVHATVTRGAPAAGDAAARDGPDPGAARQRGAGRVQQPAR